MKNICRGIVLLVLVVSAVFFSVMMSGCIEGTQLIGQSKLIAINEQKQNVTTSVYNLTIDTSAKLVKEGLSKKIIISGNITNEGNADLIVVTLKSSFHGRKGTQVPTTPLVTKNIYWLGAGETKQFEMVYSAGYPDYLIFDDVLQYIMYVCV